MASDEKKPAAPTTRRPRRARPFLESGRLIIYTIVLAFVVSLVAYLAFQIDGEVLLLIHLGFVSLVTFLVFGLDKLKAKGGGRRVSEMNLITLGAIGGAAGGLLAMGALRHKTQHGMFRIGLPILLFVHGVILLVLVLD
ncbi:MAG: hypothetical protein CMJ83_13505 [Planctomycetes bacterium]|nr:hypothetical protein [Planctomycetota bacterium]